MGTRTSSRVRLTEDHSPATTQLISHTTKSRPTHRPWITTWDAEDDLIARYPGLLLDISEHRGILTIGRIVVPAEQRGRGIGTAVLTELIDHADRMGWRVGLTPDTHFGGSMAGLLRLYEHLGFRHNRWGHRHFDTREAMIRVPRDVGEEDVSTIPESFSS